MLIIETANFHTLVEIGKITQMFFKYLKEDFISIRPHFRPRISKKSYDLIFSLIEFTIHNQAIPSYKF